MSRFKKYSFWVALMGAVVLLVENLSAVFGFEFNKSVFESVFLSVCGILVVLGIIVNDKKDSQNSEKTQDENQQNGDLIGEALIDDIAQNKEQLNNEEKNQNNASENEKNEN